MKKIAIIYSKYTPTIDAIKYTLSEHKVDCFKNEFYSDNDYDLVILSDNNTKYDGNALACHHSLLPSFDNDDPVKSAILEGVKVTGITVYYTNPKKIIAQYPVFINNNTHYEELRQMLKYLEQTIFPVVIKKIINNEQFELHSLLNKNQCSGNCGGCVSCSH